MKKIIAIVLATLMALSLAACGGTTKAAETQAAADTKAAAETQAAAAETQAAAAEKEGEGYDIAYTLLGDDWMLTYYMEETKYAVETSDPANNFSYVSAEFTSDKMLSNVQTLVASGADGISYYGCFPTLNLSVSEACEAGQVPFCMGDQLPLEEQREALRANPYFVGSFGANAYNVGYQMGKIAASMGYKKALCIGGALGDTCADGRIGGFEAAFKEAGGEILGEARCTNPGEGTQKASDLLSSYPDADCFFAHTGSYAGGAITAQENFGKMLMNFSSDIDKDLLKYVRSGDLIGDGGGSITMSLAYFLLQNYLDGCPILDENGEAPINTDLVNFVINEDNVDLFEENFVTGHPFSEKTVHSLLYKYNPDVTYDDFCEIVNNWSLEYCIELKK